MIKIDGSIIFNPSITGWRISKCGKNTRINFNSLEWRRNWVYPQSFRLLSMVWLKLLIGKDKYFIFWKSKKRESKYSFFLEKEDYLSDIDYLLHWKGFNFYILRDVKTPGYFMEKKRFCCSLLPGIFWLLVTYSKPNT